MFWTPPHGVEPLTPVLEKPEVPDSPLPYLDTTTSRRKFTGENDDIEEEEVIPPSAVPFLALFACADGYDFLLIMLGSLGALVYGASLVVYLHLLGQIIHLLRFHSNTDELFNDFSQYALYIVYIGLSVFTAGWIEIWCWILTAERQTAVIRTKYVQVILNQKMTYFDTYGNNGDIVNEVMTDVQVIQCVLSEKVGNYIQNIATFLGGLVIAFINCWQIAFLALATGPIVVAAGAISNVFIKRFQENLQDANSHAAKVAEEALSNIRTLYAFTNEALAKHSYASSLEDTLKYGIIISLVQGLGLGFTYGLGMCSCALQLWVGRFLVTSGKCTGAEIVTAMFAIIISGLGLNQASRNMYSFEEGRIAAYRLYEVIRHVGSTSTDDSDGNTLVSVEGKIEFRNVYFSYPSCPGVSVLSGIYLTVPAKKTVALVGRSGSGKSSLIPLLERQYDPTLGAVLLDGVNTKTLKLEWFRRQIGLVTKEPALVSLTIAENISYGRPNITSDQIEEAAKLANMHTFISSLESGYATHVDNLELTDEQKIKISIARAVLLNPSILLLDEVTSMLDLEAESAVHEVLRMVTLGRSTVMIARRLSLVKDADLIAVVEGGQCVEMGTHDELINTRGIYSELLKCEEVVKLPERLPSKNHNERVDSLEMRSNSAPKDPESLDFDSCDAPKYIKVDDVVQLKTKHNSKHKSSPSLKRLVKLSLPEWLYAILGTVGASIFGSFRPILAYIVGLIVTEYYRTGQGSNIQIEVNKWCLIIACMAIVILVATVLQHFYFGIVGEAVTERIRRMMFSAMLQSEVGWFDKEENNSDNLLTHLTNNATYVRAAFVDQLPIFAQYFCAAFAATIIGLSLQWRLTTVALTTIPFLTLSAAAQKTWFTGFSKDIEKLHKKASLVLEDVVANISTFMAYSAGNEASRLYKLYLKKVYRQSFLHGMSVGFIFGFSRFVLFGCNSVLLWYTSVSVKNGHVPLSIALREYIVLSFATFALVEPFALAFYIRKTRKSLVRVFDIIDHVPDVNNTSALKPVSAYGTIEFRNVNFSYPNSPEIMVLRDFSVKIDGGHTVGVVGVSGSGKSTILSLILRFYDPISGGILLDGKDLKHFNLRWLRNQLGFIQQEPVIFSTTIKQNIIYARRNASETEIKEAARIANAHHFISSLPNGYDTQVGPGGVELTPGQKLRIAIARVVLKNAPILLLDEADSTIEHESRRVVQEALDTLLIGSKTTILVARRAAMMKRVDKILVVNGGQIVEQGTHDSLAAMKDGVYAKLTQPSFLKGLRPQFLGSTR